METLSDVAYAQMIQQMLDRTEDEFGTGLSLAQREALADELEGAIKRQYMPTWALTITEEGARSWVDTRWPLSASLLSGRTVLLPAEPEP